MWFLCKNSLFGYSHLRRNSEYHIHESEDDGEYERDPESADFESRYDPRYEQDHEDIDDEGK